MAFQRALNVTGLSSCSTKAKVESCSLMQTDIKRELGSSLNGKASGAAQFWKDGRTLQCPCPSATVVELWSLWPFTLVHTSLPHLHSKLL